MRFATALDSFPKILTECAIAERIRRDDTINLHPVLFNTPLIYSRNGRSALKAIYGEYREIAAEYSLPILLCAPTWRVEKRNIEAAGFSLQMNRDAVAFMREFQGEATKENSPQFIGALLAPKNDCYDPGAALNPAVQLSLTVYFFFKFLPLLCSLRQINGL